MKIFLMPRLAVFIGTLSLLMAVKTEAGTLADALKNATAQGVEQSGERQEMPASGGSGTDGATAHDVAKPAVRSAHELPTAPVKVTVEWQGRKVTVEIPDGGVQTSSARPPVAVDTAVRKPVVSIPAPQAGLATKLNEKLLDAVKGVIEKSLKGYDAKTASEKDLQSVMEQTQKGLTQMFSNLRIAEDAAGDFTVQLPDTSVLDLGEDDKLGVIE